MNILIHDLNNEQFQSLFPEINNDIYIISDTGTIRHCIGCFGCWIKTPGKCVLKDGYNNIGKILSKAGKVTIISRCFYGCYSPFVKNILDQSILRRIIQKGECYMKICIINGSPKASESTSELLIGYLIPFIKENEVITYNVCEMGFSKTQFSLIQHSDVLIFAFPLYIDSINSALLRFLIELEKRGFGNKNINVYCIINNGFYEGWQNHVAADIMQNWCKAAGLTYGQTLGSASCEPVQSS